MSVEAAIGWRQRFEAVRQRGRGLVRFAIAEFGPLLVFWLLATTCGIKTAIAGTIGFVLLDVWRRRRRGEAFTRIYLLSSGLALVFGAIDLVSVTPFMIKYEGVITNLATGAAFVAGARGRRPLIQEIAEQRQGGPFPDRADIQRFFQLFTLFWAAYFVLKAGFYLWAAERLPLQQALLLRPLVGGLSLGAMLALSSQGRRLFYLCRALRLLPHVAESRA